MKKLAICEAWEAEIIEKYASDLMINKTAGLFEDLGFDEVASSISGAVKTHLATESSPEGYLKTISDLLLTGTLFRIHPLLSVASGIARALGVDIIGITKDVLSAVKDAISGGKTLSVNEFESITKGASKQFPLVKTAQFFGNYRGKSLSRREVDIPWYVSKDKYPRATLLQKIFGNLFSKGSPKKATWLAKGILIWALKTALIAAGLITATGVATNFIKDKFKGESSESESESKNTVSPEGSPQIKSKEVAKKFTLEPSGTGEQYFKNDVYNAWIVPVYGGSVEKMLWKWTTDIYPQVANYEDVIANSPAFKKTVKKLKKDYSPAVPNSLMVPTEFHTRKEVVDSFIQDIIK